MDLVALMALMGLTDLKGLMNLVFLENVAKTFGLYLHSRIFFGI
jgi:hypothetical protein